MLRAQLLIIVFVNCIIFGENLYIVRGELKQSSSIETISIRNCPESVDSCLYVCSDGSEQLCHPEELYPIEINTNNNGDYTDGSRYRIFFPWEYNEMTANKFTVTASWPCLSPTAVYASGNYAYFDIFGNDECPGTVQGSIWYGDNCQDSEGNIGSDDCEELIGRFCFVSGDTLNWSENADQSISTDICNACWMSSPAWSYYHTQPYSDSLMNPEYCDEYDHCHHSASDDILCGVGYLDDSILSNMFIDSKTENYDLHIYPNPFNPVTKIHFKSPINDHVNIAIYDLRGVKMIQLIKQKNNKGHQYISWDGRNKYGLLVPGGLYFCVLRANNVSITKKVILLK